MSFSFDSLMFVQLYLSMKRFPDKIRKIMLNIHISIIAMLICCSFCSFFFIHFCLCLTTNQHWMSVFLALPLLFMHDNSSFIFFKTSSVHLSLHSLSCGSALVNKGEELVRKTKLNMFAFGFLFFFFKSTSWADPLEISGQPGALWIQTWISEYT